MLRSDYYFISLSRTRDDVARSTRWTAHGSRARNLGVLWRARRTAG